MATDISMAGSAVFLRHIWYTSTSTHITFNGGGILANVHNSRNCCLFFSTCMNKIYYKTYIKEIAAVTLSLSFSSVDQPTEKRVRKWAISLEDLVDDPQGKKKKKPGEGNTVLIWLFYVLSTTI